MAKLNEVSEERALEIFRNNDSLRNMVVDAWIDSAYDYNEELTGFFIHKDHNGRNYCTASWCYGCGENWIRPNDSRIKEFLEDCKELCKTFGTLPADTEKMLDRLLTRADIYDDCLNGREVISDERWKHLETWFGYGLHRIRAELGHYMQLEYEYSDSDLEDFYASQWLEWCGEQYETSPDGYELYQTIVKKYA